MLWRRKRLKRGDRDEGVPSFHLARGHRRASIRVRRLLSCHAMRASAGCQRRSCRLCAERARTHRVTEHGSCVCHIRVFGGMGSDPGLSRICGGAVGGQAVRGSRDTSARNCSVSLRLTTLPLQFRDSFAGHGSCICHVRVFGIGNDSCPGRVCGGGG